MTSGGMDKFWREGGLYRSGPPRGIPRNSQNFFCCENERSVCAAIVSKTIGEIEMRQQRKMKRKLKYKNSLAPLGAGDDTLMPLTGDLGLLPLTDDLGLSPLDASDLSPLSESAINDFLKPPGEH